MAIQPGTTSTSLLLRLKHDDTEAWERFDSFYFPLVRRWLNIAENELSALTAQCVKGHRFATIDELRDEVSAWAMDCNVKQKGVDWQFTTEDARIKLESFYPRFLM